MRMFPEIKLIVAVFQGNHIEKPPKIKSNTSHPFKHILYVYMCVNVCARCIYYSSFHFYRSDIAVARFRLFPKLPSFHLQLHLIATTLAIKWSPHYTCRLRYLRLLVFRAKMFTAAMANIERLVRDFPIRFLLRRVILIRSWRKLFEDDY